MYTKFWSEIPKVRHFFKNIGMGGRIILIWISNEVCWDNVDCIHLLQDRDQWQPLWTR
jgi:hypothetical protein